MCIQQQPSIRWAVAIFKGSRQLPIFTGRCQPAIVGVRELNFCVRHGYRWVLSAIATGNVSDALLSFLFSHPQNLILRFPRPSALSDLSAPSPVPSSFPRFPFARFRCFLFLFFLVSSPYLDQALDLLVPASSTHHCASTASLSTLSSSRGLTSLRCGNLLLEGGFTLRCLQRLSRPYFASLLCRWHDNSCTSGTSIPVLSY